MGPRKGPGVGEDAAWAHLGCEPTQNQLGHTIKNQLLVSPKPTLPSMGFEGGPGAAHLHIIVGHENGKTAQVAALAGGATIPAAHLPAACGGPVPTTVVVTLPEGTD